MKTVKEDYQALREDLKKLQDSLKSDMETVHLYKVTTEEEATPDNPTYMFAGEVFGQTLKIGRKEKRALQRYGFQLFMLKDKVDTLATMKELNEGLHDYDGARNKLENLGMSAVAHYMTTSQQVNLPAYREKRKIIELTLDECEDNLKQKGL